MPLNEISLLLIIVKYVFFITTQCDTTIILWTFFVIELEVARTMIYEHPPFFSLHLMKEA
jgi:hypothetical protein